MLINYNGENKQVPPEEIGVFHYPNDLLDCMFVDLGQNYAFFSSHVPEHADTIAQVIEREGVEVYDLTDASIDYSQAPHAWCVSGLARLVAAEAERLCIEACE